MNKSAIGGHWNVIGIDISDSNCHLSEFEKRKRSNEESAADQQKVLKRFSSSRRRAPLSNPSRRTALNHSSSCPPLIEKHKRLALYRHELPPTRWCPYSGNRRTNTGIYTAGRWHWTTKKKNLRGWTLSLGTRSLCYVTETKNAAEIKVQKQRNFWGELATWKVAAAGELNKEFEIQRPIHTARGSRQVALNTQPPQFLGRKSPSSFSSITN